MSLTRESLVSGSVIARVAVVPQPPLLVPELVAGHDPDAQTVRAECLAAATRLRAAAPHWVAVAADPTASPDPLGPDAAGTFRGYGVDVPVRLAAGGTATPDPAMPLPALIAGWLRGQAGADEVTVWLVPPGLPTEECREYGERLGAELTASGPVGLLVIGDGSHRHGERAPGRPDARAAGFDEAVHRALATPDPGRLLGLDAGLGVELGAIGRAPWQVLSGVIAKDGRDWRCSHCRLLIPYGVAYHVAVWDPVG
jgi:hypothetical protein